ncbi:hypothetical protein HID58_048407 [Brassica napus]|uniref:Uncharacterized protein n=1 Tax=Brassica napus TaxID=3708 RepID=A0ABQ8B1Z7_BRANA|nr:hypothetical protein HID58_048407 [Brassica napus]
MDSYLMLLELLALSYDCTLTFGRGTFGLFISVLGDNLVDSWYRSRTLGHDPGHVFPESEDLEIHPSETHGLWMRFFVVWIFVKEPGGWMDFCPRTRRLDGLSSWNPEAGCTFVVEPGAWTDFRPGSRRLDGLSSWNPEAGWTFVLEPGGWMDLRPGTRMLVELLSKNLMVVWTFKGTFSYIFSTRSRLRRCLSLSKPGSVFQCVVQLPLGRLTDGTRCVRFVNLEYRDASHSTFRMDAGVGAVASLNRNLEAGLYRVRTLRRTNFPGTDRGLVDVSREIQDPGLACRWIVRIVGLAGEDHLYQLKSAVGDMLPRSEVGILDLGFALQ